MQAQAQPAPVARVVPCVEQTVLNHPHRRTHQSQGVPVVAPMVTRDIKHPQQPSIGGMDRSRCTGQKPVALQKMLLRVHHKGTVIGQCRANRIGAAILLAPGGAGAQRHPLGTAHELGIA